MTKGDFLAAYNIGHRDGKADAYCPNDYDDIFDIKQQPNDNEQIIRIKKGTLKARTGRYVIYDVEWLKTHFNTTEAKIYGQPQPSERIEERTETHACDCISREAVLDALHSCFAEGFNEDRWWNSTYVLDAINKVPSIQPQPKSNNHSPKTGHWISHSEYCKMNNLIPSGLGCYFWCSECNCGIDYKYFHLADYNYCPNCGAKMQEAKE